MVRMQHHPETKAYVTRRAPPRPTPLPTTDRRPQRREDRPPHQRNGRLVQHHPRAFCLRQTLASAVRSQVSRKSSNPIERASDRPGAVQPADSSSRADALQALGSDGRALSGDFQPFLISSCHAPDSSPRRPPWSWCSPPARRPAHAEVLVIPRVNEQPLQVQVPEVRVVEVPAVRGTAENLESGWRFGASDPTHEQVLEQGQPAGETGRREGGGKTRGGRARLLIECVGKAFQDVGKQFAQAALGADLPSFTKALGTAISDCIEANAPGAPQQDYDQLGTYFANQASSFASNAATWGGRPDGVRELDTGHWERLQRRRRRRRGDADAHRGRRRGHTGGHRSRRFCGAGRRSVRPRGTGWVLVPVVGAASGRHRRGGRGAPPEVEPTRLTEDRSAQSHRNEHDGSPGFGLAVRERPGCIASSESNRPRTLAQRVRAGHPVVRRLAGLLPGAAARDAADHRRGRDDPDIATDDEERCLQQPAGTTRSL